VCKDLLKSIHCFAGDYYTKRGLLYKPRGKVKKSKKANQKRGRSNESGTGSEDENSDDEDIVDDEAKEEDEGNFQKNMYRLMNGTALMVIGTS
jgi:hypothetical protein